MFSDNDNENDIILSDIGSYNTKRKATEIYLPTKKYRKKIYMYEEKIKQIKFQIEKMEVESREEYYNILSLNQDLFHLLLTQR